MKIIDNNELVVTKLNNKVKFKIKKNKIKKFYEKIKDILGVNKNEFSIVAKNIIGLNDYIKSNEFSYFNADLLFKTLSLQIKHLNESNLGVIFIDLTDIYVIEINEHKRYILMLNSDKIQPIKNNYLEMNSPLSKKIDLFFSPELEKQKVFPSQIPIQSCYYSIAMIVLFCLKKFTKKTIKIEKHMEELIGTPLYWSLKRCLVENIENRTLLYI